MELNKEQSCQQCCFCVYIDDLIKTLRKKKTGCWINNSYVGIIVYADDIVLLSPSIDGLQEMINTCSGFAGKHNFSFSTHEDQKKSKTKRMIFFRKKKEVPLRKMMLDDKPLPWVENCNSSWCDNKRQIIHGARYNMWRNVTN